MGSPYDMSKQITVAELSALNALGCRISHAILEDSDGEGLRATASSYLVDPRYMHPQQILKKAFRARAFRGVPRTGWILAHKRENGSPESL